MIRVAIISVTALNPGHHILGHKRFTNTTANLAEDDQWVIDEIQGFRLDSCFVLENRYPTEDASSLFTFHGVNIAQTPEHHPFDDNIQGLMMQESLR